MRCDQCKQNKGGLAGVFILTLLACGCTPTDTVYRNLYEGMQKREEMVNPSAEPIPQDAITYDAYKRERDTIIPPHRTSP